MKGIHKIMRFFIKLLLFTFLIISIIGICLQISRVSEYNSLSRNSYPYSHTISANSSTWSSHEKEGLTKFILVAVICGIGLIILPKKKNIDSADKKEEVIPEKIVLKKFDKIVISISLVMLIAIIVGAICKSLTI